MAETMTWEKILERERRGVPEAERPQFEKFVREMRHISKPEHIQTFAVVYALNRQASAALMHAIRVIEAKLKFGVKAPEGPL